MGNVMLSAELWRAVAVIGLVIGFGWLLGEIAFRVARHYRTTQR
jgi:hypothetical protein